MTGLMIIAAVVVAMAVAMGSKKNNGKFLGTSTSMLFGHKKLKAGADC